MVKNITLLLAAIIFANGVSAQDNEASYDAQSLKERFSSDAQQKATAAERIKSARGDKNSLKILQESDLSYKLPNGEYVIGMLLPNGTMSPAIKTRLGTKPACVTRNYELVMGVWDQKKETIVCNIPQSELAYIDESVKFESSVIENKTTVSNKYGAKNNTQDDDEKPIYEKAGEKVIAISEGSEVKTSGTAKTTQKRDTGAKSNNSGYVPAPRNNSGGYVPAPRNNTRVNATAGTIESKVEEYGIPRGTWIKAELQRHATSADSSNIEFVITQSVIGKFKTLEAGTVLFASKSFNTSSRRLEALTSVAVTPEGDEIGGISAYVHASDQSAGLAGTIVRDREGEAISAGTSGILAAAADALPNGAGIATNVVSGISGEMLDKEKSNVADAPRAYIEVAPQTVWLKTARKI